MKRLTSLSFWLLLLPLAIYTACFFMLTWPMLLNWPTHFYNEGGDGMQNHWNFWWIDKAVSELHCWPWWTDYLHYPHGTTLAAHTLQPIHGFPAMLLRRLLPAVQVYNLFIVGSFALGGVTTFWLCIYVLERAGGIAAGPRVKYVASLVGGFAFTFTGYHFAHMPLHMQLVAVEFIPLFLLAWLRLIDRPCLWRATAAAAAAAALTLCDLYYLLYSMLAAAVMLLWNAPRLSRQHVRAMLSFGLLAGAVIAPVVLPILWINANDPLVGAHPSSEFCGDVLGPFIPGGGSAWRGLTEGFWRRLGVNSYESSVYIGVTVLGLAAYAAVRSWRHAVGHASPRLWLTIAAVFYILSLGPILHVGGTALTGRIMPYHWLEVLLPPLRLGGVPVRMIVMTALAVSLLAGVGIAAMLSNRSTPYRRLGVAMLGLLMTAELWPRHFDCVPDRFPRWVLALRQMPAAPVICKLNVPTGMLLYYQTGHGKKMALGLVARTTTSTEMKSRAIIGMVLQKRYAALAKLGFSYLVCHADDPQPELRVLYTDDEAAIYALPHLQMTTGN
ncbi:hypothetical protein [Fontivita pretiosa]|uniref:hypothetical protein n=1 Tax=Fontivita pretiosa TaxID=2989684 RepID=UPI003D166B37